MAVPYDGAMRLLTIIAAVLVLTMSLSTPGALARQDDPRLDALFAQLVAATDAGVVGQELKRVPKGYDPDHRHADLLRHKWLQARWPRPMPDTPDGDAFVRWCAGELAQAAGVHRWLVEHLA